MSDVDRPETQHPDDGDQGDTPSFIGGDFLSQPPFSSLNPIQKQAVQRTKGPLLLLAGAGTGKTRVLTLRLAALLQQGLAQPHHILAVTFTNKAALEIRERVTPWAPDRVSRMWLGTFHSMGVRFLRRHGELVGLSSHYTILDTDDQLRLIQQIMRAHHWDPKRYPPRLALSVIGRWKDRALLPDAVTDTGKDPFYLELYRAYQARLQTVNAVDFGDLMLLTVELFQSHPEVLREYQRQFRYILVDEYQDINAAQYLWLRLLARHHKNIFCVGDDDQSIYGWRGAEVENILRFEQDFPGACVLSLEENYRSTAAILGAASGLIAHNEKRWEKKLIAARPGGDKVGVQSLFDGAQEAYWVGQTIQSTLAKGVSPASIAILLRAGFQTREFEERFIQVGIPYRVLGGLRFYERLEIRDALAYLRIVAQPDDSLAFERVLGAPKRGIGPTTLQLLHTVAQDQRVSLWRAAQQVVHQQVVRPGICTHLQDVLEAIARWHSHATTTSPEKLAASILEESGYIAFWKKANSLEAAGRLENLKEFTKALGEFETLQDFLEHVSLVMEQTQGEEKAQVSLMTLHAAKGLEFETVFLVGWEEELFPHPRALAESGIKGLEEERRLAYVGLTRAKCHAYISYAHNRRMHQGWRASTPSRFIDELPSTYVEILPPLVPVSTPKSPFGVGGRVMHAKFGPGTVIGVAGLHIEVAFEYGGQRKVMASFLRPC